MFETLRREMPTVVFSCFCATYRLWNKLSLHTWSEFLLQTSALTRIARGLVERTELSELVPGPQSSRGHGMLDSVNCPCSRLLLHQVFEPFEVVMTIHDHNV